MGILIYRGDQTLDGFAGPMTGGGVDGGATEYTGDQLLTIVLDLTPDGGYNGTDNFGTITFIRGDVDTGTPIGSGNGSFTYSADRSYGSVGLTATGLGNGSVSNFQVTQVPEPSSPAMIIGSLALVTLLRRRR